MMAYRSAEHETTGCTPNALMLGREVATPIDITYQIPSGLDHVTQNRWAWKLKEKLQEAHSPVREHVHGEMQRQKRYHDAKLNWEKFVKDDQVYVFFPTRKVGNSLKLTSYWRVPYQILCRISDLLYEVNCGICGKPQVIHVDRLRPLKAQTLSHKILKEEKVSSE